MFVTVGELQGGKMLAVSR